MNKIVLIAILALVFSALYVIPSPQSVDLEKLKSNSENVAILNFQSDKPSEPINHSINTVLSGNIEIINEAIRLYSVNRSALFSDINSHPHHIMFHVYEEGIEFLGYDSGNVYGPNGKLLGTYP